jgi:quercetin dioxygenase-like cupin family protein
MAEPTFEEFVAAARAQGYDAFLVREWAPGRATGERTHPFDATLHMARGGFRFECGGPSRDRGVGDRCDVARGEPHAET